MARMDSIQSEIANLETQYQTSYNESEKKALQRKMSKLTTEYLKLSEKLL